MGRKRYYTELELAGLAKEVREKSGKTMAEVARLLGVSRSVIYNAENVPTKSLLRVRIAMITQLSKAQVEGAFYRLNKRKLVSGQNRK